jgi:hypothetical protein
MVERFNAAGIPALHIDGYMSEKGYAEGWASHQYKTKFGVWPKGVDRTPKPVTKEVRGFITHTNIKRRMANDRPRIYSW